MNITQLKLNGYAVTVDGNSIDAHPGAPVSRGLVTRRPGSNLCGWQSSASTWSAAMPAT